MKPADPMCIVWKSLVASVTIGLFSALGPNLSTAADSAACAVYAYSAVAQNSENRRLKCGGSGGRWDSDHKRHYNWCRNATAATIDSETLVRGQKLKACRKKKNKSTAFLRCHQYALLAVVQQNQNLGGSCGYKGNRWNSSYASHYGWCLEAKRQNVFAENSARDKDLGRCAGGGFDGSKSDDAWSTQWPGPRILE